jgi:ADP-L-glycero-D-manno-heptose 6-epimerase
MKILLTGHKGFIGQNMLNYLKEHTNYEIDTYDLNDNWHGVMGYDWVIHLGACTSTTERDIDKVLKQNYDFSVNLYEDCRRFGVNLQFASSASVYGQNIEFTETSPLDPITPYAWSKYLFERYVSNHSSGNIVHCFRYFNVYGKYEDHKGGQASPIHQFVKQAKENNKIKIFDESHKYFRDFICVEDICRIHLKFIETVNESGTWNLGTGKATSFEKVAEHVLKHYDGKIKYIMMPEILNRSYQKYTCSDNTKLEKTIGIQDWITIKEFLKANKET